MDQWRANHRPRCPDPLGRTTMVRLILTAGALLLGFCPVASLAEAAVGPVYEIIEPDLIVEMKSRARDVASSAEFQQLMRDGQQRSIARVLNPDPVQGLSPAFRSRSFYYDPTIVVERDILAPDGQVIAAAGTRVNPLEQVPWKSTWFFLDGRDARQVAELRRMLKHDDLIVKPILVAGSPFELGKKLRQRVFFDQHGLLVQQFGIQFVPATIRQDGLRLRIDEFPPSEAMK